MFVVSGILESKSVGSVIHSCQPARMRSGLGVAVIAALMVTCGALPRAAAIVVTDDFSDGNDTANPQWIHLNNAAGSTGQTWDASGGKYRLHDPTTTTFGSVLPGLEGYGFVGSYVEPVFTDVRVTVDIVDFVPPDIQSSYFAVAARLNGSNELPTEEAGFRLHGYSYQYEGAAAGGNGEMVLNILSGAALTDVGSFPLTLDGGKDYRVIFEVIGNVLHGQVLELDAGGNVVATVADQTRDLDANPPGIRNWDGDPMTPDAEFVPYASGYSGVYGIGHVFYKDADFTVDNFRSESLGTIQPGDFNADGNVDGADLAQWKDDFGVNDDSDADVDGDTDGADFLIWQQNYGAAPLAPAVAAVPEPGTLGMLGVAAMLVLAGMRRTTA
jgi:hypothetical protein